MSNISAKEIAALRAKTDLPVMEIKRALVEANGDEGRAIEILKQSGHTKVSKKAERETACGIVESYCHNGKIGVLVEVKSETDFVAKNEQFRKFVHDIALQITATNPKYLDISDVPKEEIEKDLADYKKEAIATGKPVQIAQQIADGKIEKYLSEICLLKQPFIKDQDKKIEDLLAELVSKIGENIKISRFYRIELGR